MNLICPYPGLRPFNENESIFFKGREDHIDKIINQLQEKKYLMVTGASGDGKSSLIYAGLIPRSRAGFFKSKFNNWIIADLKPERSPLTNLAIAITEHLNLNNLNEVEKELSYGFSSLIKLYKESNFYLDYDSETYQNADFNEKQNLKNRSANLLILIDQFEELFTNAENFSKGKPSIQAITLINLIIETTKIAAKQNIPIYIVSTMRSDYVGDCAVFKGLPELMVYSQFFVPRLKRQEIQRAIVEPSKLSGNKINNRLVERLINELGEGQDQLPILQHALNRIWKTHMEDSSPEMDLIHYAKVGGINKDLLPLEQKNQFDIWYTKEPEFKHTTGWKNQTTNLTNVLNAHARELFETSVSYCQKHIGEDINRQEAHELLKKIFTCLTKINDNRAVRNRLSVAEIKNIIGNNFSNKLLEGLVNIYRDKENTLLRPFISSEKDSLFLKDTDILDITHESLIRNWTELTEWTKKEQETILIINDLTKQLERWVGNNQSKDFLLTTGSVNYYNSWMETTKPNPYLIAKYDLSNLTKQQKLEEATEFLQTTTLYIDASQANIKRRQKIMRAITAVIICVLICFTSWAFIERNKAVKQQTIANQKTQEALVFGKYALSAEQEAVRVKDSAVKLKELAQQSEKLAVSAKLQAELSKQEAIAAKLVAEAQKLNAIEQTKLANNEKTNAEKQTQKAEQQKLKAEQSELKSQKLKLLSIAQNLTLKSALYKNNNQLMGKLAVQAYKFNKDNGGIEDDPIIYDGLKNAYAILDDNKHTIIANAPSEMRVLTEINKVLYAVDLDGKIYAQNYEVGTSSVIERIEYGSPINTLYFNQSNNNLITGHENFTVCLWDTKNKINPKNNKQTFKEFKGHKGLIRAAVISSDEQQLATAGKDSLLLIWNIKPETNLPFNTLKTTGTVKALVFVNNNKAIIAAQTDGKVIYWDFETNQTTQLYKSANAKPLCLAYNSIKNALLVGLSEGTLLQLYLNTNDFNNLKIKQYKAHASAIENITFNADFSMLATSSADKLIKFYNYKAYFESGNLQSNFCEIKDNAAKVKYLLFNAENKIVASLNDKSIHVWETSCSKLVSNICNLLQSNLSKQSWNYYIGEDIPYQKTCESLP